METIGAFDAKTRLSELLERAARGESFVITKHGHPIARLVPERGRDRQRSKAAVERLKAMRGTLKGVRLEDLTAMKHEEHER